MRSWTFRAAAAVLGLSGLAAAHAAAPLYRVDAVELRAPEGFIYVPGQLNDEGDLAGSLYRNGTDRGEAFVYRGGQVQLLGTFGGLTSSVAGLNRRGEAAGNALMADDSYRPFIYSGGRARELPLPSGAGGSAVAVDINNRGHVLGYVLGSATSPARAFIYDGRASHFLDTGDFDAANVAAFNDRDEVVGSTKVPFSVDRYAYVYRDGQASLLPRPPDEPPLWDFTYTSAADINNAGQIVVNNHGILDGHVEDEDYPFFYENGRYTRFGDNGFAAYRMNQKGWVIGATFVGFDTPDYDPGLYRNGQFYGLNALVRPADKAWDLEQPWDINDRGQILGFGNRGFFIATPVPEAPAALLMLAGLGLLGAAAWRRTPPALGFLPGGVT